MKEGEEFFIPGRRVFQVLRGGNGVILESMECNAVIRQDRAEKFISGFPFTP